MKIERIGEKKIKVTVSLNDLKERNIDLQSLTYNSTAAQELLWDMMEQAESQYGFDFSNVHIVFEPIADFAEGFIITITQLDEEADIESLQKYIKSKLKKPEQKTKRKSQRIVYPLKIIYGFDALDDICAAAGRIFPIYSGESFLYKLKTKYYLILKSITPINYIRLYCLLNEYGERVSHSAFFEGYLNEYGQIMIEKRAIDVLNKYFQ